MAGHAAGRATGWLSHETAPLLQVSAVGSPSPTRPLPYVIIRRRSNLSRLDLAPIEVAYLEAVRAFDNCAEVDWGYALRITAKRAEHRTVVRPSALMEAARTERCKNVELLRKRVAQLCGVLDGTLTPADPPVLDPCPSVRFLEARHLPWFIETGDGHRKRTVPISQFVKNWAHRPDERSAMCEREPVGPNRLDLVRIAATVHALCDRDGVAVPSWVWRHRWHEDVRMYGLRPLKERDHANALPVSEYHRVFFSDDHIYGLPCTWLLESCPHRMTEHVSVAELDVHTVLARYAASRIPAIRRRTAHLGVDHQRHIREARPCRNIGNAPSHSWPWSLHYLDHLIRG